MKSNGFIIGCLVTTVVWFVLYAWTINDIDKHWQERIVAHKAAEYYLDEKNERQWRWIDPIKP